MSNQIEDMIAQAQRDAEATATNNVQTTVTPVNSEQGQQTKEVQTQQTVAPENDELAKAKAMIAAAEAKEAAAKAAAEKAAAEQAAAAAGPSDAEILAKAKALVAAQQASAVATMNTPATIDNGQVVNNQTMLPNNIPAEIAQFLNPTAISMQTAEKARMGVTAWVKTSEYGMCLDSNIKAFIDDMLVEIDMTEGKGFEVVRMVRIGVTSPIYEETKDNLITDKGRSWAEAVKDAWEQGHQKDRDQGKSPIYTAAKIPMVLLEPAVSGTKGEIAPVGTELGYTTPKTGWQDWAKFYESVEEAGLLGQKVKAKIFNREISHNGNNWGVLELELVQ